MNVYLKIKSGLRGGVNAEVLSTQWKSIKDAVTKNLDKEKLTPYAKQQIEEVSFLITYINKPSNRTSQFSTPSSQASTSSQASSLSMVPTETDTVDFEPQELNLEIEAELVTESDQFTQEVDMPPPSWFPAVKSAAQRQQEWNTAKKIESARNPVAILGVDEANREVDPNFPRRKQTTNVTGLFGKAIDDVEKLKNLIPKCITGNQSSSFAVMLANKVMALQPNMQQIGFDKALEIMTKYTEQ